ncbi:BZ3500_MvSof-1268-A1-R1_Chr4-2g07141 [Microbotryum saponariae]|uniref:BZ3500_MvSof-1268-A1-R1_Chr4-2g07141 protein n=1 Tax=Microbotryum saponariae TaxID=289078 RepID=A0A2X0NKZ7_9BASI|nr:BZ3500_MvSof-1268-A1-R1_Chr4-2g07141 [Microbotryum saponariae]SDA06806.1 BZ3501_MvSof-1269-A2-R1_Chr4-2g06852 [Microbotryum saponariae]
MSSLSGHRRSLPFWTLDVFTSSHFHGNPAAVLVLPTPTSPEFDDFALLQNLSTEFALPNTAVVRPTSDRQVWDIRFFSKTQQIPLCGHATMAAAYLFVRELKTVNLDANSVFRTSMGRGDIKVSQVGDVLGIELLADGSVLDQDNVQQVDTERVKKAVLQSTKGVEAHDIVHVVRSERVGWIVELSPDVDLKNLLVEPKPIEDLTPFMLVMTQPSSQGGVNSRVFCPSMGTVEDQVVRLAPVSQVNTIEPRRRADTELYTLIRLPQCGSAHCSVVPYILGTPSARARLSPEGITQTKANDSGFQVTHLSKRGGEMFVTWKEKEGTCVLSGDTVLVSGGNVFLP